MLVAAVVFFILLTGIDVVFGGASLTGETLFANGFRTLVFAMAFAAIKVGLIMFRDTEK